MNDWKLVPVEPTPEMLAAADRAAGRDGLIGIGEEYRAMLAAAPTPASALSDEQRMRSTLEALVDIYAERHLPEEERTYVSGAFEETMDAARALLAAAPTPAQEPVAWMDQFGNVFPLAAYQPDGKPMRWVEVYKRKWKPLYSAPQPAPDARAAVIEECAKVCDVVRADAELDGERREADGAQRCVDTLRALIGTPGSTP